MHAKFATVAEMRDSITAKVDPEYVRQMFQPIPDLPLIKERHEYLVEKAKGRVVLDIGCTGPISKLIREAAKEYHGFDKQASDGVDAVNLDADDLPVYDVEIVICSEILEHLSNPGHFLDRLKNSYPGKVIYFTVPNAGSYQVIDKCEVVNREHVCWYSYATLQTLLMRHGFKIIESRWCNGPAYKAETIIMVTES